MRTTNPFSMIDKRVLVTGAAGGMGRVLAEILLDAGATVILSDKDANSAGDTLEKINNRDRATFEACDLREKSQIESLIHNIKKDHKGIDVLVNCAGVLGENRLMMDIDDNDWDQVFNVNLKGMWLLSTAVSKIMIDSNIKGSIVNISSSLGARAQLRRVHYATSKAGVEHLTRNMAIELVKYGIRVNCLAPGWTATPMVQAILDGPEGSHWQKSIPMGRAADPSELTGPLLLLASDASSYMTGSTIRVDGGYSYFGIESE